MDNKTYENNINYFVSSLVNYHLRARTNYTVELLAEKIGISKSFINKAISSNGNKHFNVKHLFLIANALNLEPNQLFPSIDNYKLLTNKDLNKNEWDKMVDDYKNRGNSYDE